MAKNKIILQEKMNVQFYLFEQPQRRMTIISNTDGK